MSSETNCGRADAAERGSVGGRRAWVAAFLLLAAAVAGWVPAPRAGQAPSADARSLVEAIQEVRLDNGLRIFVLERPLSPTFAAYYQFNVGAAYEPKGRSGIAHMLEHMMFKGTRDIGTLDPERERLLMARIEELWREKYALLEQAEDPFGGAGPERLAAVEAEIAQLSEEQKRLVVKNEYDELLTRAGGARMNASTGNDVTNYYVCLPVNQLENWFELESERLLHPVFREFYTERDVVREERRLRTENSADGLAYEALDASIYHAHPYGNPVIGWARDIERYDRADAEAYFRTFYSPSNCVMALVGDITAARVEELARRHLGPWQRQEVPRPHVTAEPEQRGERRTLIEFEAEPALTLAWPTVAAGHADAYALDLLARVLGGMASARLDRALVQDRRMAASIGCYHGTQRHGGAFTVSCTPRQGNAPVELEGAIREAIAAVQRDGVPAAELERAKVATEARRVRQLDNNLRLAMTIGRAVGLAGDPAYLHESEARLLAVTPDDVARVARDYLLPERLNVVTVVRPEGSEGRAGRSREEDRAGGYHAHGAPPGPRGSVHSQGFQRLMAEIEAVPPVEVDLPEVGTEVERLVLPSGITLFLREDHTVPAISLSFAFLGGSNTTPPEELAPFELAGALLIEGGTDELTPQQLEERLDELGMSFSGWIGGTQSGARFWSLSRNFEESFALAAALLTRPRLDGERLEVLKGQYVERMRRRLDRPASAVGRVVDHVLYQDHPRLGRVTPSAEVAALTPEAIRAVLERHLACGNLYLTAVGDFDRAALIETIEGSLGGWRREANAERIWITRPPVERPGAFVVAKEIPQPAVTIVQELAVDRGAPPAEHAAIEILNQILGGSGFRSRLTERLRSDEGLTYGIRSSLQHDQRPGVPGQLRISYQTRREAVLHSIDLVLEEVRRICAEEVSAAEVREQIQAWQNSFVFRFDNEAYSIQRLMDLELDDRPYDHDRLQLEQVLQVTPEEVLAVARKYLAPERATIAVFGALTPEDEAAIAARFGLTQLAREEVFSGGY